MSDDIVKIGKKIVGYSVAQSKDSAGVAKPATTVPQPAAPAANEALPVQMNETLKRPEMLVGTTYKIKSPMLDHAMYITINDILLNEGTNHEHRRPFEIFINSKEMDQFQWIVALTRIMSAVFRKGGDLTFLVEEMRAVFDPKGGYFRPGGEFMPSVVAEIGATVERHLVHIGMIAPKDNAMAEAARAMVKSKQDAATASAQPDPAPAATPAAALPESASGFPATATMCNKCHHKSVVIMDGCATCLNCGNSKCG